MKKFKIGVASSGHTFCALVISTDGETNIPVALSKKKLEKKISNIFQHTLTRDMFEVGDLITAYFHTCCAFKEMEKTGQFGAVLYLANDGYGTKAEIVLMDTPQVLPTIQHAQYLSGN